MDTDEHEAQYVSNVSDFLNDKTNASQKLDSLISTVESVELEYKSRNKQRIADLQLVLNNAYASKGILRYTKEYKNQLSNATLELTKQLDEMDKSIHNVSSDVAVKEKRYADFRNKVVGQASECLWPMDKLLKLLESDKYDDDALGSQLSRYKRTIEEQNEALHESTARFKQIRYGHAMQYHHDRDAYIFYRKNADLTDWERKLVERQFDTKGSLDAPQTRSRGNSIFQHNHDDGMLIDLNED
eukprot:54317_1